MRKREENEDLYKSHPALYKTGEWSGEKVCVSISPNPLFFSREKGLQGEQGGLALNPRVQRGKGGEKRIWSCARMKASAICLVERKYGEKEEEGGEQGNIFPSSELQIFLL